MLTELVIFVTLTTGLLPAVCTKLDKKPDVNKMYVGPESLEGYATYIHKSTDQSKKFTYDNICKDQKVIQKISSHRALMSTN